MYCYMRSLELGCWRRFAGGRSEVLMWGRRQGRSVSWRRRGRRKRRSSGGVLYVRCLVGQLDDDYVERRLDLEVVRGHVS